MAPDSVTWQREQVSVEYSCWARVWMSAVRIELWGDDVERISRFDPLTGEIISNLERTAIYPASHSVTERRTIEEMAPEIRAELAAQLTAFRSDGRLLEAQRLEQRTMYDIEMLQEMGFCHGVENYSRWLDGRSAGLLVDEQGRAVFGIDLAVVDQEATAGPDLDGREVVGILDSCEVGVVEHVVLGVCVVLAAGLAPLAARGTVPRRSAARDRIA